MFYLSLVTGLTSSLTPLVFPLLIMVLFVFEKMSTTNRQHYTNIALFSILVIGLYFIMSFRSSAINFVASTSELIITHFIIDFFAILFSIGLIFNFRSYYSDKKLKWINPVFRFIGLFSISAKLAVTSLSSATLIISALLVSSNGESVSIINSLIGFSIGLVIPFIIVLILAKSLYKKHKEKKWFRTIQAIFGFLFIVYSVYSIWFMLYYNL